MTSKPKFQVGGKFFSTKDRHDRGGYFPCQIAEVLELPNGSYSYLLEHFYPRHFVLETDLRTVDQVIQELENSLATCQMLNLSAQDKEDKIGRLQSQIDGLRNKYSLINQQSKPAGEFHYVLP